MRRQAAAVDEYERAAGPEAADVDRGVVTAGALAGRLLLSEERRVGNCDRFKEIRWRRCAAQFHVLAIDDEDGKGRLQLRAPDVGSGDSEGLEFHRLDVR